MLARLHHQQHASELLEIDALHGLQRVLDEEWNDAPEQMLPTAHPKGQAVAVIDPDDATSEKGLEGMQQLHIALVLYVGELRQHLHAGARLPMATDRHVEASFTVHKTADPFRFELHWAVPNVKSLRVPGTAGPSLRIVPVSVQLLTASPKADEY